MEQVRGSADSQHWRVLGAEEFGRYGDRIVLSREEWLAALHLRPRSTSQVIGPIGSACAATCSHHAREAGR